MLWTPIKILLPTFLGYWVFVSVLAVGAWWAWTRMYPRFQFKWAAPLVVSSAACLYMMGNMVMNLAENAKLSEFQQKQQASTQPAPDEKAAALQMKGKFLKVVESMILNPDQITPDAKNKLFAEYGPLFQKPEDKRDYENAVAGVYSCQRVFWEDAMASYKAKTPVKSDSRKDCEKMSGAFFNREKLIPVETAKSNDDTVTALAARKRLPASDGKMVEVSETMLRNILDAQVRASEAIKKIFD